MQKSTKVFTFEYQIKLKAMSIKLIIEHNETKEKKSFKDSLALKNFTQDLFATEQADNTSLNVPLSSDEAISYLQNDSTNWQVVYRAKEKLNWEY